MDQETLAALEREFLTADELKDRLKVSKATIRRWTLLGIPHLKLGGRLVRFEIAPALRWLETRPMKGEESTGE